METGSNPTPSLRSAATSISSSASSTLVAPSSTSPKARKVSSGRGGSGNLVKPSKLKSEFEDDFKTAQKRLMDGSMVVKAQINYVGRAGTGNIHAAAKQRDTPYDFMLDPDDTYEESVKQKAKEARSTAKCATGRGGTGNVVRKTDKQKKIKPSKGKRSWHRLVISTPSSSRSVLSFASGPSAASSSTLARSTSSLSPVSPFSPFFSSSSNGSIMSPQESQITLNDGTISPERLGGKTSFTYGLSRGAASMSSFVSPVPLEYIQEPHEENLLASSKSNRWWKLPRRQDKEEEVSPGPEPVLDLHRQFRCADTRSILSEETAEDLDSEIVHIGSDWEEDDLDPIEEVDDGDIDFSEPQVHEMDDIQRVTETLRLCSF
ncbi:hypothetical protein M422DRAFT_51513 [Sphaerobolus stellatus SS14]|uniref:Uncharacterized protein n=1 Tax=Sphaerobolus stellatus (strain SS14) TaxID=990650 RepID=A0A0C9TY60_SPHS4|nr:hypothetical protein M422DRAFT_51513 [Sphaerobolus stellatus SS14]